MSTRMSLVLGGTLVLLIALALGNGMQGGVSAQAGAVDFIAVDADPTGNTATSLSVIDDCGVVSAGSTFDIDVAVGNVPPPGVASFGIDVLYDPAILMVTQVNYSLLLTAAGGTLFSFTDPLPDGDGDYRVDVADLSSTHETGDGVLMRVTFQAVGTGVSSIALSDEILQDGMPDVTDPQGAAYQINEIRSASISVGANCPSPADLRVTSAAVSAPAQVTAGDSASVTVDSSVENGGPYGPVNSDITTTLVLPSDCSAVGGPTQVTQDVQLSASQSAPISHSFTVICTGASFHTLAAGVTVAADDPIGVESHPSNNSLVATSATMAVVGESDLSLGSITSSTDPPEPFAGMQFIVNASVPVTNAGPYGPATAATSVLLTMPTDCAVYSPNPAQHSQSIGTGETGTASVSWKAVCNDWGDHSLSLSATVSPGDLHVTDPVGPNDAAGALARAVFAGICGPDPDPDGDPIQEMSPQLIALAGELSDLLAENPPTPVPPEFSKPLSCVFNQTTRDIANTPINDCPIGMALEQPCALSFDTTMDLPGGSPIGTPTARLAPIGVTFVAPEYDWATDAEVPNGSINSEGEFRIRTDGALTPLGTPCKIDVRWFPRIGYEGAIEGNAPETNDSDEIFNPYVWPNDLNGERAAVESSFTLDENLGPGVQLWSRTIIPLITSGISLPLNVLTWKITDPAFQTLTGAGWVVVPFPGDAVNPDAPGAIGGNPDMDDPYGGPIPVTTCAPHNVRMSFSGTAGGAVFIACTMPGSHMTWQLLDPDARSVTGDEGPRTESGTCSADLDNDGVSQDSEQYWGTNVLSADSDGDGHPDGTDNCKTVSNPGQEDLDSDGVGDICDPDDENDGVVDTADNCPVTVNPGQENAVHPGTPEGDHCEDPDDDSVVDRTDNCPDAANPAQENAIHPESPAGDHCDDPDGDGVVDIDDNCVDVPNVTQQNRVHGMSPPGDHCDDPDDDTVMDVDDNCPDTANSGQENGDGDDFGDVCEAPQCLQVANYWTIPTGDGECDGFPDTATSAGRGRETFIGTDPSDRCADSSTPNDETGVGISPWPPDFNDSGIANNGDIILMGPSFNKVSPNEEYNPRFDLNANGSVTNGDVILMGPFFNKFCTP